MLWLVKPIIDEIVKVVTLLHEIKKQIVSLNKQIAKLRLPVPGPLQVRQIPVENDPMALVYQATLPALPDPIGDIKSQLFQVNTDEPVSLGLDVTLSPEFRANDDQEMTISLSYVDDAGNVSAPSTQTFIAKDTIPPDAPGAFGQVTLLREEA